jgi:hypothetical protein
MTPNIALSNTNKRMIDNKMKLTLYNTVKKQAIKPILKIMSIIL